MMGGAFPGIPSIEQLFSGVKILSPVPSVENYSRLVSDSRKVSSGDIFVCLAEQQPEQEAYIEQALAKQASIVVLDSAGFSGDLEKIVLVEGLSRCLSQIAGNYYGHPSKRMSLLGVTGTNGKSTVCSWVEQLFQLNEVAAASIGTLGVSCGEKQLLEPDGMTTRDAIRAQETVSRCKEAGAEMIAMEVSSHGMDQYRVEAVCFAVALCTNFSRDHLDYHLTETEYWQAKKRLFDLPGIRCAVLNIDDEKGRELARELSTKMQVIKFSAHGDQQADIFLSDLDYRDGFHLTLNLGQQAGPNLGIQSALKLKGGQVQLHLPQMTAEFELSNLLAALAATSAMGLPLQSAIDKVAQLKAVPGRLQMTTSIDGSKVFVDYAHTPDAISRVLAALRVSKPKLLLVVLGCGGDRDAGKRPEMARVAITHADRLIITSDNPRSEDASKIEQDMLLGVEDLSRVDCITDRREAIRFAIEQCPGNSCVAILGKGHESTQIIGDWQLPFSDIEVVEDVIAELRLETKKNGGES
jgi:UDP-N-acetylmuramoyl-L-alanyl-D-glutamate--2,6-diaminopimelate ligase|tara:strand:+ start:122852 stop:124423 length:1572 start_codon:yes stop_codon:yes gene_type:complete